MPQFYFNIRKSDVQVEDIEGEELPDLAAAKVNAEESLLILVADYLKAKSPVDIHAIEICDAQREVVGIVSVGDVLPKVIPPTILQG
jgi:CBS-domain-containing membrane protein